MKLLIICLSTLFVISCKSTGTKKNDTNRETQSSSLAIHKVSQVSESHFVSKMKCTAQLSEQWQNLVHNANSCIKDKNNNQLLKISNKLSIDFPNMPWGNYYKSVYFYNKNLSLKSLWIIDNVIKKYNNTGVFKYHKARVLYKLNYLNAAKKQAIESIQNDKNNFSALLFLSQLELESTHYKNSIKYAELAMKIRNDNEVQLLLGEAYFADKQYKKALSQLNKLKKKDSHINFKIAYSYEQLEKIPQALLHYKQMNSVVKEEYSKNYSLDLNEKIKEFESTTSKNRLPSTNKGGK